MQESVESAPLTPRAEPLLEPAPAGTSPVPAVPARGLYFLGPWYDALSMGGVAIAAWAGSALLADSQDPRVQEAMLEAAGVLALLLWYPHIVASSWPLYVSRARVRRYAFTAVVLPVLMLYAVFLAIQFPRTVLPCLCKAALWWWGYHLAMQTYALSLIYARRAGLDCDFRVRGLLGLSAFSIFVYSSLSAEFHPEAASFLSLQHDLPSLPAGTLVRLLAGTGVLAGLLGLAGLAAYTHWKHRRLPPAVVFLPPLAQFVWLVPGAGEPHYNLFFHLSVFSVFHGLQYLYVAPFLKPANGGEAVAAAVGNDHLRHGLYTVIGCVAIGALLFRGFPAMLAWRGIPGHLAGPAVLAGLLIVHFFQDGVLWKARSDAEAGA